MNEFLTNADVRQMFGVSDITVFRWRKQGWLRAYPTPTGRFLYKVEEVEAFRIKRESKRLARAERSKAIEQSDLESVSDHPIKP